MTKSIKNISFNVTAIMTLIGVIIGGLITGYFSNKSQKELLEFQKKQFINEYRIDKNNRLQVEIEEYVDNLSKIIFYGDKFKANQQDSILSIMYSNSLNMTLLRDLKIGSNSMNLTIELKKNIEKPFKNDSAIQKLIGDWIVSIKSEMAINDYSIDKSELASDILKNILLDKK